MIRARTMRFQTDLGSGATLARLVLRLARQAVCQLSEYAPPDERYGATPLPPSRAPDAPRRDASRL